MSSFGGPPAPWEASWPPIWLITLFFFQAEDGIRNTSVTGVQTCALPISNPVHLSQVFQNLLGNAIKYRRPDVPLKVHVSARRQVDDWLFFVRDNGMGFAPE